MGYDLEQDNTNKGSGCQKLTRALSQKLVQRATDGSVVVLKVFFFLNGIIKLSEYYLNITQMKH